MKLFVIGCGNMGSAMVKALLGRAGTANNSKGQPSTDGPTTGSTANNPVFESITVFDHSRERSNALGTLGAHVVNAVDEMNISADGAVLIAVKPQDLEPVFKVLKGKMAEGSLVISIATGVPIARFVEGTGCSRVVRVMPNTPVLVGAGASGWIASAMVTDDQKAVVKSMLESFGIAVEVDSEDQLDRLGTLSGCGPAYVYYFMEALIEGGVALGLNPEQALQLTIQTVQGGALLATHAVQNNAMLAENVTSLEVLQTLRAQVTSKGGVTEQAIRVFDENDFKTIVVKAMQAAYQRTQELGH